MAGPADTLAEGPPAPPRKKFAVPPVKIACLAWGGPRIRKKSRQPSEPQEVVISPPPVSEELPQQDLHIEEYIAPGAGLKSLVDIWPDSGSIYNSFYLSPDSGLPFNLDGPVARTYGSDRNAILNAYYIWIHPYFPILPPPENVPARDEPASLPERRQRDAVQEPSSPVGLAISAILALIPCPDDVYASSEDSIRWRRTFSHFLAKAALESIESESDLPESSVDPPRALDDSDDEVFRERFHPQVPVELEGVIALDILSVYEYAQRGNLKKMRARSEAALMAALSLRLHKDSDAEDASSEARRRVWWMTYICVCQGSIVSNTPPTFDLLGPRYTTKFPTIQADPEAFSAFVQAQKCILSATLFVIEFNSARNEGRSMAPVYHRMRELEKLLSPLIKQSNLQPIGDGWRTRPVDRTEAVLANALRCMARIKLNSARIKVHRYSAFFDAAVFPSKHCDLTSLPKRDVGKSEPRQLQACCVTALSSPPSLYSHSAGTASPITSDSSSPYASSHPQTLIPAELPFSTLDSSRICLESAFNIAQNFDALPYPNPSGGESTAADYLHHRSSFITPRTMPSFACCAMQCSYALLMVKDRTDILSVKLEGDDDRHILRERLQQGLLSILATLENYATAFEALGGMRDQIRDKIDFVSGLA
ncbi:hypothetical protein F5Y17DRAFT_472068 [Xylariaceae sp. FL0594]|nr:hypothetical protein F5Y17DRAFT_472068 [Xylariaceae sp. FL0594]